MTDGLLKRHGLSLSTLEQPGFQLPWSRAFPVFQELLPLAQDPSIGLRLGRQLNLRSHGFLGYAILSSRNIGEAVDLLIRYLRTRVSLFEIRLFREHNHAVIQIDEGVALGPLQFLLMDTLITLMMVCGRQVTGLLFAGEIRLAYPRQTHHQHWPETSAATVVFDAAFNQIRFPRQGLNLPITSPDPQLLEMALQQCEQELSRLHDTGGLIAAVRQQAREHMATDLSVEFIAQKLGMSSRTLRRRLTELGTSYQMIIEQLRRGRAVELLRQTSMSVEQIASELGYDDPSNFGRAFRRWTGLSPSAYRQQADG
ncbi:MAG: AraC family transcriptional regulator ligand-binding domain-containing protein [Moraxellaceae bacterium]|nr:AraC family transcriptional regulator ligand-binding domain-containing protein [Moraxellaceae bacterium]MDZ4297646.1 AraC family transcriptional regulator ligand-binding domain-containing protein [Moraxellaceae bacterium]MDZ4385919.1 AraC family transcriptional regulator ligand-binding domain-containing protein [Moraxellaceae bacterium]